MSSTLLHSAAWAPVAAQKGALRPMQVFTDDVHRLRRAEVPARGDQQGVDAERAVRQHGGREWPGPRPPAACTMTQLAWLGSPSPHPRRPHPCRAESREAMVDMTGSSVRVAQAGYGGRWHSQRPRFLGMAQNLPAWETPALHVWELTLAQAFRTAAPRALA